MAWPLTGSALTKYNRLLSDLRQYGDFIFVGAPDDITWLQETIVAASDGQLRPPLDDVANRSHYWMLRTIALLGDQTIMPKPEPCPECPPVIPCPPCPPCPDPTGLNWEADETTINFFVDSSGTAGFPYNDPTLTGLIFNSLEIVTLNISVLSAFPSLERFSAPKLRTVGTDLDFDGAASLNEINLPVLETVGDFLRVRNTAIVEALFPALVSVGISLGFEPSLSLTIFSAPLLETVGGGISGFNCPLLSSINLDSLISVGTDVDITNCDSLVTLSFPAFVTHGGGGGGIYAGNSLVLANLNFPSYLPPDGSFIDFSNCALTAASVNHILARGVANAAFVSGQVDLAGGISAAPTGQGIADKATLIGRGVTVNTN